MRNARLLIMLCCAALGAPSGALAQQQDWSVALTPYVWAAGVSGESTLPRQTRDFSVDFGDLLSDLNFALMGTFEARYAGRFSLVIDGMTLTAEEGFATPRDLAFAGGKGELEVTQLGVLGLVRAWQEPGFGLDVGAGLRAWWIDTKVSLNPGLAAGRATSGSANLVDPILALRSEVRLSDRWSVVAYGDIGGFDTGSRLTWQVLGAVSWQATQGASLQLGYRHLAVDASRGDLALDVSFGGPILGLTIRF